MLAVQELYQLSEAEKRKTMMSLNQKLAQVLNNPQDYPININFKRTITNLNRDILTALQSETDANKWLQQASLFFKLTQIDPDVVTTPTVKQQHPTPTQKPDRIATIPTVNLIDIQKPQTLAQAIQILTHNYQILDAHVFFIEFLINHPSKSSLSKQLEGYLDDISVSDMDNQQQKEVYNSMHEGLNLLDMLNHDAIDTNKLPIYKNILCLTSYQQDELTENQLIGLFEFQKRGTIGVGFIKAIIKALSRNRQMPENKLNVLDMLILSKFAFKTEGEKISYHVFINKLMKFQ